MKQYDIVIIGGGIHGVGIAQAAAVKGYTVLLLEQTALAAGTSSKSSKLIHGGLRYLESGQIKLVNESLRERAILLKIAPGLVKPTKFYLPIYKKTSRPAFYIAMGLTLYTLLGKFAAFTRFHFVPEKKWSSLSGLETNGLKHVFQYWDAQTDDKKLTEAVMSSATNFGAEIACPAKFNSAGKTPSGYEIFYSKDNEEKSCHATILINAAGPWVNMVLDKIRPATVKRDMDLVQGAHVVIKQPAPVGVFYAEAPEDKRAIFMMPWLGQTLIGTTESLFTGDPADAQPTEEEIEYLLRVTRHYFPNWQTDEVARFAGLRVLPRSESSAFSRPRETVFHTDMNHPNLFSIYGGKLTGYRATAEKMLKRIKPRLPIPKNKHNKKTDDLLITQASDQ